jgi:hypothetical protein
MRTLIRFVVTGLLVATPALGEDKAPAQKPAPPKPAPALVEAFKDMAGTWSCSGEMDNPQSPGTQVKTKSEMHITPVADGFAYTGMMRMEKNAAMPAGAKAVIHWAYDGGKNKLVELGSDNGGGSWQGTSDGQKEGTTVWIEDAAMGGQSYKSRTTVTRKSPKEVTLTYEMENKSAWQKMGEDTCKKK